MGEAEVLVADKGYARGVSAPVPAWAAAQAGILRIMLSAQPRRSEMPRTAALSARSSRTSTASAAYLGCTTRTNRVGGRSGNARNVADPGLFFHHAANGYALVFRPSSCDRISGDGRKKMESPMRMFIVFAVAIAIVATGYAVRSAIYQSPTVARLLTVAAPAANTMSPHEIHLNYKGMKDLPVHDSNNAH
jgi:hypothetical protein